MSSIKQNRDKEKRKQERKHLGKLRDLTVQPKTKERYNEGMKKIFDFLRKEGLQLPTKRDAMDNLVSDYLEFLWSQGEGRAMASTFMAGLQDSDPKPKHCLPASWRLLETWSIHEVPSRAPPLTEPVLRAMVGWAFMHQYDSFALSLLVAFFGLLRTGELLNLQAWQIHMVSSDQPAVINLGLTKAGKRQGAAESITLTEVKVLQLLWKWKQSVPPHTFLTAKPHAWRAMFSDCITKLKLGQWEFRPYYLRRGGATHLFVKCGSLDRVLLLGRWTAVKIAKIYLNSGLAMLSDLQIPQSLLSPFHRIFADHIPQPPLEQALLKSRAGGRGKKRKASKNKGGGNFRSFRIRFFLMCYTYFSGCLNLSLFGARFLLVWREFRGTWAGLLFSRGGGK